SVPGLYVINDLVQPQVGVRGVTGGFSAGTRIVKIMINGVPVSFRPELNAFIGPEFIPMEVVERVEIAKGPLSALYGANAFLATVNVITREPSSVSTEAAARYTNFGGSGFGFSSMIGYGGKRGTMLVGFTRDTIDRSGLAVSHTFPDQDFAEAKYNGLFTGSSMGDVAAPMGVFALVSARPSDTWSATLQGGI